MSQPSFPKQLQELWLDQPGDAPSTLNPRPAFPGPGHRHRSCFVTAMKQQEEIQKLRQEIANLQAQEMQLGPSLAELLRVLTHRMNQLGQRLGQQLKECPGQVQQLQDQIASLDWLDPTVLQAGVHVDGMNHGESLPEA